MKLIWSEEHGAWWAPEKGGYTRSLVEAGRYEDADADLICRAANMFLAEHVPFNEIAIPDPLPV